RRVADLADELNVTVAPHFATQLHVHLAACQPREGWVEWFDWLDPLFEERLTLRDGRVVVPDRPGLGLTLSARSREWLVDSADLPEGWRCASSPFARRRSRSATRRSGAPSGCTRRSRCGRSSRSRRTRVSPGSA